MQIKTLSRSLALVPMLFATVAMAEKGLVYENGDTIWRNSAGECWTTDYRDKDTSASGCFGEPMVKAEGDADGDGVVDSQDQCPDTPAGTKVDAKGCELDSDGDGVVDSADKCPGTPAGATVDAKGCALGIVLKNVNFETNSGTLTADSRATLDQVAASIKARGDIKSIEVIGHTDSMGAAAYNQQLSEKRAKAVADYLVGQGVSSGILSAKGMGESQPVADNRTAAGRAENRRVELKLNN